MWLSMDHLTSRSIDRDTFLITISDIHNRYFARKWGMERRGMFNSRVPNINQATGTSKQTRRETVWNRDTKWNGNRDNNGDAIRSNNRRIEIIFTLCVILADNREWSIALLDGSQVCSQFVSYRAKERKSRCASRRDNS